MKTTQYTEVVFQWHIRNNSDGSITFGQKILIYESENIFYFYLNQLYIYLYTHNT